MADGNKNGGGDFGGPWFVLIAIVVVIVLFQAQGGGGGLRGTSGIRTGSPSRTGTVEEELSNRPRSSGNQIPPPPSLPPPISGESPWKGKVSFDSGNTSTQDPTKEYVTIRNFTEDKILISAWSVVNSNRERYALGGGWYLPFMGQTSSGDAIVLNRGDRAHVISGKSPIGINFKANVCTGYFNEFHEFTPRLREDCPRPEGAPGAQNLETSCVDFLETLPRCRQVIQIPFPTSKPVSNECRNYATTYINYNNCVEDYKNEKNFSSTEWYIYLGRSTGVWKDRKETITLKDGLGRVVEKISY